MTFLLGKAPIPIDDPIALPKRRDRFSERQDDPLEGILSPPWVDYISRLALTVQNTATRLTTVTLATQSAAIGATDIGSGSLNAGLYGVSYYARITQAAGVSSSLEVGFSWTDGGIACQVTDPAITGNTVDTSFSDFFTIRIDSASPVRYFTNYATVGVPSMQYHLDVILTVIEA